MLTFSLRNGLVLTVADLGKGWCISDARMGNHDLSVKGDYITDADEMLLIFKRHTFDYDSALARMSASELSELSTMLLMMQRHRIPRMSMPIENRHSVRVLNGDIASWNSSIEVAVKLIDNVIEMCEFTPMVKESLIESLIPLECWNAIEGILTAIIFSNNK